MQVKLAVHLLIVVGAHISFVCAEEGAAEGGDVHPLPPDVPPDGGDKVIHKPQEPEHKDASEHEVEVHADDYKGLSPDAIRELKVFLLSWIVQSTLCICSSANVYYTQRENGVLTQPTIPPCIHGALVIHDFVSNTSLIGQEKA